MTYISNPSVKYHRMANCDTLQLKKENDLKCLLSKYNKSQ